MAAHIMNVMLIDTLASAERIDFDASSMPLMMTKKEVASLCGWSTKTLDRLEKDGRIVALQRGLSGQKFYRTDEVLEMCGYKAVRK